MFFLSSKVSKIVLMGLMGLLMLAYLSACSQGGTEDASSDNATLTMGTGPTGTGLYGMGASVSNVIRRNSDFQVTAQTTGGTPANINLLATDQVDMIFVSSGDQDVLKEIPEAQLLYVATPYAIQFGMQPGSNYSSIEDMKGSRLAVPAPGTGGYTSSEAVFDSLGLKFDDFHTSFMEVSDSDEAFRDKKLDVLGQISAIPHPGWFEISSTGIGIDIYQFTEKELTKISEKHPEYSPVVIPAGTYIGQDEDVKTLGIWARVITTSKLSEEQAYDIAKVMHEKHEEIVQGFGQMKDSTVENTIAVSKTSSIPLHPGVVKYFKEIGALK